MFKITKTKISDLSKMFWTEFTKISFVAIKKNDLVGVPFLELELEI